MTRTLNTVLLAGLLMAAGDAASAQGTASATARAVIPQVLYVSVPDIDFGTVTPADFEAGDAKVDITVIHRGNVVHDMNMKADAPQMSSATSTKPVSDVMWKPSKGAWRALTTADDLVVDDAAKGDQATDMRFRVLLDYATDRPGTYTVGVTFTVVAS